MMQRNAAWVRSQGVERGDPQSQHGHLSSQQVRSEDLTLTQFPSVQAAGAVLTGGAGGAGGVDGWAILFEYSLILTQ